jgi:RNA polymerase sigma factor FliA
MTCVSPAPIELADLIDIVDTALATISRRLPQSVARDDLASVGKIALIAALRQSRGSVDEVRAYCFVRVRGAILDELRRLDPLSRRRRDQTNAVVRQQAVLTAQLGRAPTGDEIARATGLSVADVASIQAAQVQASDGVEFEWNSLPDTESLSPADAVEVEDIRASLREAIGRLSSNQALALRRYYLEGAILDDIAIELGVSRERVRQIREAGEAKLRADFVVLALWQSVLTRR